MCLIDLNDHIRDENKILNNMNSKCKQFKTFTTNIYKIYEYSIKEYPECEELINYYKRVNFNEMNDNRIYREICWVIYSSGFKYDIIKKYWSNIRKAYYYFDLESVIKEYKDINLSAKIICKKSGFKNLNKAKWCIYNAHRINEISDNYGCLGLKSMFKPIVNADVLDIYNIILEIKGQLGFKGIGNITIFHLLKNIGINIYKPDIHVSRIFKHIGLCEEISSQKELICILDQISHNIGIDLSSIDTALFILGKNNESNLENKLDTIIA